MFSEQRRKSPNLEEVETEGKNSDAAGKGLCKKHTFEMLVEEEQYSSLVLGIAFPKLPRWRDRGPPRTQSL